MCMEARRRGAVAGALSAILFGSLAVALAGGAAAQNARSAAAKDCATELARGRAPDFICTWPALLRDKERADLRRLTREELQDARCTVAIKIERRIVMEALIADDYVFESPAQPVACEIEMKDGTVAPVTATFAPRVVFKGGQAIDGTPGLGNVKGVNSYLSWPVVQYVNRAPGVKKEMLRAINVYRERRAAAARQ